MVVKLYISGISGNKEVKKKQQRVQMILDSKQISYEAIDITEPGKEKDKEFMQQNGKVRESLGKHPLPPQIFNDDNFCGDYEDFDLANEVDELEKFLHIETATTKDLENGAKVNGIRDEVIDTKSDQDQVNGEDSHKVNGIADSESADDKNAAETTDVKDEDDKMDATTTNPSHESGEADQADQETKEAEDTAPTMEVTNDKVKDESGDVAAEEEDAEQKTDENTAEETKEETKVDDEEDGEAGNNEEEAEEKQEDE